MSGGTVRFPAVLYWLRWAWVTTSRLDVRKMYGCIWRVQVGRLVLLVMPR